jgi:hypothetical protein
MAIAFAGLAIAAGLYLGLTAERRAYGSYIADNANRLAIAPVNCDRAFNMRR